MQRPKKTTLWAPHFPSASSANVETTFRTKQLSLGGASKPFAIYVPLHLTQANVKEVKKKRAKHAAWRQRFKLSATKRPSG